MGAAVIATGAMLISGPQKGFADKKSTEVVKPRHIPGGTQFFNLGTDEVFHFFFPGTGIEQSTITDFDGVIGSVAVGGTAVGTNTITGEPSQFFFGLDNRFMKGTYIGIDGEVQCCQRFQRLVDQPTKLPSLNPKSLDLASVVSQGPLTRPTKAWVRQRLRGLQLKI